MRLIATYHISCDAASIEARAQDIAVEQSVEMPLTAIDDPKVLADIVGKVETIIGLDNGRFAVQIGLAAETIGHDAGQLLNMLFGNTSLHPDVMLADLTLPPTLRAVFAGPRHGIPALRQRLRVPTRAFTGSVLKPQGLPPERLAMLAEQLALGGLDFVKDDHGLADQEYSRFADRVRACAAGVARAVRSTGHPTRYIPSLTGNLDQLRMQATLAREAGLDCVMIAPMMPASPPTQALIQQFPTWRSSPPPASAACASCPTC